MALDRVFKPNDEQLELLKRWYAPDVSEAVTKKTTNAFGMTPEAVTKQKPTRPVADSDNSTELIIEDVVDPATVTAQELESIRATAQQEGYDEGFSRGQEKGILSGHDEGYQQGLDQGKNEGQQQAYDETKVKIDAQLTILSQLIEQFQNPLAAQEESIEQALVALALDVAVKIVHTEVQQSTQPIVTAVSEGVRLIGKKEPINVRLNEQDIAAIEQLWDQEQLDKRNVTIEVDPAMTIGSCEIESHTSSVQLNLAARIEQVFDDFHSQPKPDIDPNSIEESAQR
ncbi:MAG: flagellar assembly protein FliH [Gammaproteobacteria bacterium]|nr:flagellar assembly protein FliH [Gammaproteobacteria bacterium]